MISIEQARKAALSLPETEDKEVIFPVPGAWGKHGATFINLKKVKKSMLTDALTTAWKTTAPPKLVEKYFGKEKS